MPQSAMANRMTHIKQAANYATFGNTGRSHPSCIACRLVKHTGNLESTDKTAK